MSGKQLSLAVLLLTALVPQIAEAQRPGLFHRHHRRRLFDPCGTCGASADCGCAAPVLTPQAVFGPPVDCCPPPMPIIETCMVPQQCTTFVNVPQTCFRQEPVCQTVPITTTRQITVDEGCYQTIWVPRMVTKNIAETTLHQQLSYRTVPYTTVQRVPVTQTHMVPQQRVTFAAPPCPIAPPIAPGCCGGTGIVPYGVPQLGPAMVPGAPVMAPPAGSSVPALPPSGLGTQYSPPSASIAVPPGRDTATPQTSAGDGEWSAIERRQAFLQKEFGGYRPLGSPVQQASYSTQR